MATLHFTGTDVKVFTPISAALANLPNGPGTIVVLVKTTNAGVQDFCGLLNSAGNDWFHMLGTHFAPPVLWDDDGLSPNTSSVTGHTDTADWWLFALDWGATAAVESYHWRDQTTLSGWTHENSVGNGSAARVGPGTGGFFRLGYALDNSAGAKDEALVAAWAGTRFASSDYGSWSRTSDLYNHAKGAPTFLCQLNSTTPVDLIGGSTYSSANSSGTTLTGADPDNWTLDGLGGGVSGSGSASGPGRLGMFTPQMRSDAWF